MNSKIELLQKLKALTEKGVGGEKRNAENMLNKLMDKYNISETELSEDTIAETRFTYHGKEQERLLLQIIYKVTNATDNTHAYNYTKSNRKCRTIIGADVTAAQKIEIEFLFDFYVTQYEKERTALLNAFIQKHHLYGKLKLGEQPKRVSPEEIIKMSKLMKGLDYVSPIRRLEAAENHSRRTRLTPGKLVHRK